MFALSSLVLAAALCPSAAQAGHFDFAASTYTNSDPPDSTFQAPLTGGGHYLFGSCRSDSSTGNGATAHANMSVTITLKATWTHDAGQTDANDPAPPLVCLEETGSSFWSGVTHTSTPPTGSCSNPLKGGETELASTNPIGGTRSGHQFTKVAVSGGVATLTRTFSGTASAPSAPANWSDAKAGLGSYQVTIHAQPYNFHQLGAVMDNGDGTLSWNYVWNSTTGNLSDIGPGCTIYEYVSYDGNTTGTYFSGPPAGYAPPHPPVGPASNGGIYANFNPTISPNPTVPGGAASAGAMNDIQDKPYSFAASSSCVAATWTATQTYKFDDTATGEKAIVVPGPGAGPMTITRHVYPVGTPPNLPTWYYTVNKSGSTSTPIVIP